MQLTRAATILGAGAVLCLGASAVNPGVGQPVQVVEGRVELGLVLRQLNTVGTFMMATAHPDDENNALLALLAKGRGLRTVLVTATRGDGGQNEIGPELSDALAVLRTEELLAAHRLDGAEQYFTRAIDFGYSFSRDETFELWGRDAILADFVRMIRRVRPEVIAAMSPDGRGGGQHHQASAVLAQGSLCGGGRSIALSGAVGRRPATVAAEEVLLQRRVPVRVRESVVDAGPRHDEDRSGRL